MFNEKCACYLRKPVKRDYLTYLRCDTIACTIDTHILSIWRISSAHSTTLFSQNKINDIIILLVFYATKLENMNRFFSKLTHDKRQKYSNIISLVSITDETFYNMNNSSDTEKWLLLFHSFCVDLFVCYTFFDSWDMLGMDKQWIFH